MACQRDRRRVLRRMAWQGGQLGQDSDGNGSVSCRHLDRARQRHAHTLRHTAATWLMQNGAPIWEAAGFLGMSEKTLRETYGHHHPHFMRGAVDAVGRKPAKRESLAKTLADDRRRRGDARQTVENIGGGRSRSRTCLYSDFPANREKNREFLKNIGSEGQRPENAPLSPGFRAKFPKP